MESEQWLVAVISPAHGREVVSSWTSSQLQTRIVVSSIHIIIHQNSVTFRAQILVKVYKTEVKCDENKYPQRTMRIPAVGFFIIIFK